MKLDWLVVGAGCSGAVVAERIASQLGKRVLVVDRRDHIGGDAYDHYDEHGILVHRYGPHIFHTNDARVWNYLSQFTEWRTYYHRVLGVIAGEVVPIPFNLNSLGTLFPPAQAQRMEEELLREYGYNVAVPILKLRQNASSEVRSLAEYIYRNVFKGYTRKQWGVDPEELGPDVTARVPVSISRDNRYFHDCYQAMPAAGFTEMFRRMLAHKNISLLLNTDFRDIADQVKYEGLVYTGPIDAFFDFRHGRLPYRSVRFEFSHCAEPQLQPVATVNYPNEQPFTRITEFKHMTGQKHYGTTVVREYPEPYEENRNEPCYPFPTQQNQELAARYAQDAADYRPAVHFTGRLAEYRYLNMDQAVARALMIFETRVAAKDGACAAEAR